MASGIVITVAEKLFRVLNSHELKDICSIFGYESHLVDLATTMSTMKSVLLDAESKHQALSHGGQDYVERLKDAVYDADDLLDEFNTLVQKEKIKPGGKISKKVRRFFSRSNQILVAHKMSYEIKKLRENLDKIAKDHQQFGLSDVSVPIKRKEETISYGSEDSIIGREVDKEAIVGMLLGDFEILKKCSFITIVGIGGLGKTALAQLVYNDSRIENGFDMRLWVCVSEDFGMEEIFRKMVGREGSSHNIEELQNEVRKLIDGKRYLLVLDDVWCESRNEWDKVKAFLGLGGRGSMILITTRSKKVASVVGDELMHELQGLSEENSWNLFKRMAFKHEKEPIKMDEVDVVNNSLINIGKDIVKKCANVPLCIRVVGSMLYEQNESKWLSFRNLDLTKMGQGEEGIMPILKFSYHHLTPILKSCFSYCALFPKDWQIEKYELIKLWLAEGCLQSNDVIRSQEELGEECFSILLNKCFLQDITKDECDEIISCKMHDLIHDLARDVAGKECQMLDNPNASQVDKKTRHVSFIYFGSHIWTRLNNKVIEMKTLRTVFQVNDFFKFDTEACESDIATIFRDLRHARVLYLRSLKIKTLPNTISRLSQLRSLNLSWNRDLKLLPESIAKLHNLQVLDLSCTGLRELPRNTMKLVNLRHLNLMDCRHLTHMPMGMNNLTCLHTLTDFIVGDETSKQKIGRLRDLEALVNLSGELRIIFKSSYRCNLSDLDGAELLQNANLKTLVVAWKGLGKRDMYGSEHETMLQVIHPKHNLKLMRIEGYQGLKLPTWAESVSTSLPFLVRINLENCNTMEHLPSMSDLRHLKTLSLESLENLKLIQKGRCDHLLFFPSLETLELRYLPKFTGWCGNDFVHSISSFSRLHSLDINDCPKLASIPACPNLKTLHLLDFNEALTFMGSERGAPNLEEVWIDNARALNALFGMSLEISIERLVIKCCMEESLSAAGEGYLIRCAYSIKDLEIIGCQELKSLSGSGIAHCTNLQRLQIYSCPNLELDDDEEDGTMTWASLHSLPSLELWDLPKMVNLPEGLQYSTRLQSLKIVLCNNLEKLPEWLSCITSLTSLFLYRCDNLRVRCSEPNGKDWPKIRHIPDLAVLDC